MLTPCLVESSATLEQVLDSLVSRLDATQRQAFRDKMAELDAGLLASPCSSAQRQAPGLPYRGLVS